MMNLMPPNTMTISTATTAKKPKLIPDVYASIAVNGVSYRSKGFSNINEDGPNSAIKNRNSQNNLTYSHTMQRILDKNPPHRVEWDCHCKCPRNPTLPFCMKAHKWFEIAKKYKCNTNFEYSDLKTRYYVKL
jgi:hypothetical protein